MLGVVRVACVGLSVPSCSRPSAPTSPPIVASPASSAPATPLPDALASALFAEPSVPAAAPARPAPALSVADAHRLLFVPDDANVPACADGSRQDQVHCLLAARYASDPRALALATSLFDTTGDIAGVLPAETMDGGFRGKLHLVPEPPVLTRRKHLEWASSAMADYDDFFHRLSPAFAATDPLPYRWRALGFRFMRSEGRTTPSAYASGWDVAYNVDGSLNTSADAVRELLFHEIFHLNDEAHGDWSVAALGPTFDAIVARCRTSTACLTPYAPTNTRVRGGTYYAFQPNNGAAVHEYAAELALRYYREQRAVLRGEQPLAPFKCGPLENASAWSLLSREFFSGIDRTAACR